MRLNLKLLSVIVCQILLFSSCSFQGLLFRDREQEEKSRQIAINKLNRFSVESIDLDYIANCKARIATDQSSYSGTCQLVLTRHQQLQLTVLYPLGGTILKIYVDHKSIQLNDFVGKKSYRYDSSMKQNLSIPIIRDLSLDELQTILWGRLTPIAGESLEYEMVDNKPIRMMKRVGDVRLEIIYKRWLEYNGLQFPAMIEIYNRSDGSSLKLAVTQFEPGFFTGQLTLEQLFIPLAERSF